MASIKNSKGGTITESITGTPALYVVGPPQDRFLYNGDVQGRYVIAAASTYRWIHDERRPSGAGVRTGYAAT